MPKLDVKDIERQDVGSIDLDDQSSPRRSRSTSCGRWSSGSSPSAAPAPPRPRRVSEVRGTSKKLCKQKGTGNARQGSQGAALGRRRLAHGPKPRSYAYQMPRKAKKEALRAALSLRTGENQSWSSTSSRSTGKTKSVAKALAALGAAQPTSKVLIVDAKDNTLAGQRHPNLAASKWLAPEGLNVYDILRHQKLVLTQASVKQVEARAQALRTSHANPTVRHQAPAPHREDRRLRETGGHARPRSRARITPSRSSSRSPRTPTRSRSSTRSRRCSSVSVTGVRTIVVRGKLKRVGRFTGRRPAWKKAIVTLRPATRSSSSRESERHGHHQVQADLARAPRDVQPGLRRDHQEERPRSSCSSTRPRRAAATTTAASRSRFRGGGHKRRYRQIDFKRNKIGVPAKVAGSSTTPTARPDRAAALRRRREALHPGPGQARRRRRGHQRQLADIMAGNSLPLRHIPSAPSSTASSSRSAAAPSSAGPPALTWCSWPRKATGRRCACPRASCVGSTSTAGPRSAQSATPSTATSSGARPAARAGWASARTTAASR